MRLSFSFLAQSGLQHFLCYICKEYVEDLAKIPESFLKVSSSTEKQPCSLFGGDLLRVIGFSWDSINPRLHCLAPQEPLSSCCLSPASIPTGHT